MSITTDTASPGVDSPALALTSAGGDVETISTYGGVLLVVGVALLVIFRRTKRSH